MVAHLTVDNKGVRGDQPGFDKNHVATFGAGAMGTNDFSGQTTWNALVSTLGWTQGDKSTWPSTFHYSDPRFVKTMDYIRSLADRGYAPKFGEFSGSNGQNTISDIDLLGSAKVALEESGSWSAGEFAKLPTVKVGIAPVPYGPDGKTRKMTSNSNGNNIWAGTKNPDLTWKWVSYMGSAECQTAAGKSGTFFPSIPSAMDATAKTLAAQGIDLSVYTAYEKDGNLFPAVVYGNGAAMQQALQPLFEAYFSHQRNDDVFQEMTTREPTSACQEAIGPQVRAAGAVARGAKMSFDTRVVRLSRGCSRSCRVTCRWCGCCRRSDR